MTEAGRGGLGGRGNRWSQEEATDPPALDQLTVRGTKPWGQPRLGLRAVVPPPRTCVRRLLPVEEGHSRSWGTKCDVRQVCLQYDTSSLGAHLL